MFKLSPYFSFFNIAFLTTLNCVYGDAAGPIDPPVTPPATTQQPQSAAATISFNPFTGRVLKNKVRMRLQPSLDSTILRELNSNDFVIVTGEKEDFYAIQPPKDIKGYVFRTFVLDGVIEGNKVNVRLEPDLSAPIIAQMNTGDQVVGTISPQDKKWLEISPPSSTRFYIAKSYIEKAGDVNLMSLMAKKEEEADALIETATANSKAEMEKPFESINLYNAIQDLNIVVTQYKEFPDLVTKAKDLINRIQEEYGHKKEAFMAAKKNSELQTVTIATSTLPAVQHSEPIPVAKESSHLLSNQASGVNSKMATWLPIEQNVFELWTDKHPHSSLEEFYQQQSKDAVILTGIVEPYSRSVKNKPGDYILVNQANHLPIAYLYSTKVNLQDLVGQETSVRVTSRNNHNFAFPAYFVLSIN